MSDEEIVHNYLSALVTSGINVPDEVMAAVERLAYGIADLSGTEVGE